jgi:MtN3 and saliva related transmembrane protein
MKYDVAAIVGIITITVSLGAKIIGYPSQIKKIIKNKSSENVSITIYVFAVLSYILWTVHGIVIDDWVTIFGQGLGIIVSLWALYVTLKYKPKGPSAEKNI